ncbi:MAG: threonine--tRNA ligase [Candidatus Levybacteria bacterium RBG_16_35_6]|nr:MAG: threonine--tRNA ligase [Candidatus Levybacteria bacterium RBG_16_35_6]
MNNQRSHQEIGQEQDLFTISKLVGSGLPLFTPKGTVLRRILNEYIDNLLKEQGYEFVWIPAIARKELFEKSGHFEKFSEDMFPAMKTKGREYVLKPANCPHHIQIFMRKPVSYREMPQRYAESATQYRSEQSGELEGLVRVLAMTLDDSHVFAREDQIREEFKKALWINQQMLKDFNLKYWIRLSTWDPKNQKKYLGDAKTWEKMQHLMEEILKELKVEYKRIEGEAAFYGPKMDLIATDSLEKEWQLSTIQVDFNLPDRFDLSYIDENNDRKRPIMLHRATFGSYERFLAMIIEHFQGAFPVWLSPIQLTLIPIAERHTDFARKIADEFKKEGIRVEVDSRSETMQNKIRQATLQKVPYMGIIGDKEINDQLVSIRTRKGEDLGKLNLSHFVKRVKEEIDQKV